MPKLMCMELLITVTLQYRLTQSHHLEHCCSLSQGTGELWRVSHWLANAPAAKGQALFLVRCLIQTWQDLPNTQDSQDLQFHYSGEAKTGSEVQKLLH